jgi:hypothetical protein
MGKELFTVVCEYGGYLIGNLLLVLFSVIVLDLGEQLKQEKETLLNTRSSNGTKDCHLTTMVLDFGF